MIQNTINRYESVKQFPRFSVRVPNFSTALVQSVAVRVDLPLPQPTGARIAVIEVFGERYGLAKYDLFRVAMTPLTLVVGRAQTMAERFSVAVFDKTFRVVSGLIHLYKGVAVSARSGVMHLTPAGLFTEHGIVTVRNRTGLHDMKCNKIKGA